MGELNFAGIKLRDFAILAKSVNI